MKILTPVLVAATLCFGCGQAKKQPQKPLHARNAAPLFHYGNPVLLQYDQYVNQLDTEARQSGYMAVQQFERLFKNQPPEVCDTALYIFNDFHSQLCLFLNARMEKDSINYDDLVTEEINGHKPVLSKKQKAIAKALTANGFSLNSEEGMAYIEQDQHFIVEHFGKHITPVMKQYLVQLGKEQKEGLVDDGGLTITPQILVDRTVWWEQFAKVNPHFLYANTIQDKYNSLMYLLMAGTDNTSVREYTNDSTVVDSLSDYYNTAWSHLHEKYALSATNAVIYPYFVAWQKKDTAEISKIYDAFMKKNGWDDGTD